jgi:HEPN domain-containing protein
MRDPDSNYSVWLAKAENDLLNIRNNLKANDIPWDTVCFHAQQAAEKLLKEFLVRHGRAPSRTHDLVALLARCLELEAGLAILEDDCHQLTYYAVGSRYPDDLFEPTRREGMAMVASAERVRESILQLLST